MPHGRSKRKTAEPEKPKYERMKLAIWIPQPLHAELRFYCDQMNLSFSHAIQKSLIEFFAGMGIPMPKDM